MSNASFALFGHCRYNLDDTTKVALRFIQVHASAFALRSLAHDLAHDALDSLQFATVQHFNVLGHFRISDGAERHATVNQGAGRRLPVVCGTMDRVT